MVVGMSRIRDSGRDPLSRNRDSGPMEHPRWLGAGYTRPTPGMEHYRSMIAALGDVHTGAVAPGRRDEHFGGFFDFTSAETGELGFVGVGNKSVPLAQRFFGVYVVADPFRLPHPVVEKVVDTLDNVPGGLPHAKRWHALSAPALYRSPSGPGGGLSLIFSGRDYAASAPSSTFGASAPKPGVSMLAEYEGRGGAE